MDVTFNPIVFKSRPVDEAFHHDSMSMSPSLYGIFLFSPRMPFPTKKQSGRTDESARFFAQQQSNGRTYCLISHHQTRQCTSSWRCFAVSTEFWASCFRLKCLFDPDSRCVSELFRPRCLSAQER